MAVANGARMRGDLAFLIALSLVGCGGPEDGGDAVDGSVPPPTGPWGGGRRVEVTGAPSNMYFDHTLSPDRLEIFVNDPNGGIARATRATVDDAFGPLENVA